MDSTSYLSGHVTAYFESRDEAQKACDELLDLGVPSSAVALQNLETGSDDFQDALNRLFGSDAPQYEEGSILTVDDSAHGKQILAVIQHHGGDIQDDIVG
jgi:hypothetical protein